MAAIAERLPGSQGQLAWLWDILRQELMPYRGRVAIVARMLIASTLMMIITLTFQLPYGDYATLFAITISRESLEGTKRAVRELVLGFALGGAWVILGGMLVFGDPFLRLLWILSNLFLTFYVTSALKDYTAAARFGYIVVIIAPVWDRNFSGEYKLEQTLWVVGALALASIITLLIEMAFAGFKRTDDLTEGITDRLHFVEEFFEHCAGLRPAGAAARSSIERFATVGTSRLRRTLQRANYPAQRQQQMGAVVALTGRLVDLAANLAQFSPGRAGSDCRRLGAIAERIAVIRTALAKHAVPQLPELPADDQTPCLPLVREIEGTVSLITAVFTGSESLDLYALPPDEPSRTSQYLRGALSNPEHIKFALRGCLAASLCYILYNALDWPGIATSVTTCFLTALTTVGSSRQKQFLRFSGAIVGGFIFGMGAQIFILPYIDTIAGFALLFLIVTTVAAWIATSSSRLSYFGVQVGFAFYLVTLGEYKFQTSLTIARDRVVGILVGLFMMWLTFDRLWSAPAGVAMRNAFVASLRSLAQLARAPDGADRQAAIARIYELRDSIHAQFDNVRSLADGVLLEFGASRQSDLAFRDRIRKWQPQLRTLFLMRVTTVKYRLQLPGFELPEAARVALRSYDERCAEILENLADRIDGKPEPAPADTHELLEKVAEASAAHSLVHLLRQIDGLVTSLVGEIAAEFPASG